MGQRPGAMSINDGCKENSSWGWTPCSAGISFKQRSIYSILKEGYLFFKPLKPYKIFRADWGLMLFVHRLFWISTIQKINSLLKLFNGKYIIFSSSALIHQNWHHPFVIYFAEISTFHCFNRCSDPKQNVNCNSQSKWAFELVDCCFDYQPRSKNEHFSEFLRLAY